MADDPTPGETPVVPMLALVACNKCRRRRGAQLHATGSVEPIPETGTCPHGKPLRTIWAAGYGPGSEPPAGSGWDTRPPV
ncbi:MULTISPECIES: hypothetical protein [unclassified Frankia]|uniref:hypothetical protein n=1 Tax=unclassified Frankia TaxID=2632575 RepID=UPI002AD49C6B|nr:MULTISPECIES: hypothetical protein [unclassified Frankia]